MPPVSWPSASIFCDCAQLLARFLERDLRLVLRGDVARERGEADEVAGVVADGVHHHAGVKAAAVLAHQPALRLELAFARGGRQRLLRHADMARLLRQEDAEMTADDFAGGVALHALRRRRPSSHAAFGVEHIDRVVAHALEQQLIVLLALAQRAFGLLARGHVEADAEHADGGAVLVAHHLADALQVADAAVRAQMRSS